MIRCFEYLQQKFWLEKISASCFYLLLLFVDFGKKGNCFKYLPTNQFLTTKFVFKSKYTKKNCRYTNTLFFTEKTFENWIRRSFFMSPLIASFLDKSQLVFFQDERYRHPPKLNFLVHGNNGYPV